MGEIFTRSWKDRVEALLALALARRGGGGGGGMTIVRDPINIIGTEGAGVTAADNAAALSAEIDILGDNKSVGSLNLFVHCTSAAVATGTVDVSIFPIFSQGGPVYSDNAPIVLQFIPDGGSLFGVANLPAARLPSARFFKVNVLNNGTGVDLTDIFVGAEVTVTS